MNVVSWPADKVERRPVAGLVPYARNARQHTDAQVAQIAASIREWGWTNPVLLDESQGIIAGHGRVLAAHMLGIADIPVMVASGWSEAQRRAYVLADNKLALNADWDEALLRVELADLQAMGFGVELTGFTGDELAELLAERGDGLTDPDDAPDPPAEPVSRLGDVWLLGRHRLVCGDSTTVERVPLRWLVAGEFRPAAFRSDREAEGLMDEGPLRRHVVGGHGTHLSLGQHRHGPKAGSIPGHSLVPRGPLSLQTKAYALARLLPWTWKAERLKAANARSADRQTNQSKAVSDGAETR